MRMHANATRRGPPLGISVLGAELGIGPSPTGSDHHRLQIILPRKALRHWTVVASVVVNLLTGDRPAGDEVLQSFLR
jgi:hypothetical protein